jgi:orotate phosphoribosyltransferase
MNTSASQTLANDLLDIGAVQFNVANPFTWVSGIKSPVYCDNRKINSHVEVRDRTVNAFCSLIREQFGGVELIAGVATGGMPLGALIADRLGLPFVYVRQERKSHGLMKQVEGECSAGQKVVLIEDHISTGGSSLKAIQGVRDENLDLLALVSVMTYNFEKAAKAFADANVRFESLCNLDIVANVARQRGSISGSDLDEIITFRDRTGKA